MTAREAPKVATLLFLAAIVQVTIFSTIHALGGRPDLLLVTLVAIALLRGAVVGAVGGFFAGLVVDTATLETLGLTSLLLTIAGYWIGRYGETTGRDRAHAPFVSVAVVTVMVGVGALALHFVLGEHAPARLILLHRVPAAILFNLILTLPVYALCRRLLDVGERGERVTEVEILG